MDIKFGIIPVSPEVLNLPFNPSAIELLDNNDDLLFDNNSNPLTE